MKPCNLLHLFNCFQVGGVERQHFLLVKGLSPHFQQTCWAYHPGPLEQELREWGIETICGPINTVGPAIRDNRFDCVVMRTHRYFRDFMKIFSQVSTPLIYIKDYLRWFEGNDTFIDADFDTVIHQRAQKVFYCGPSLREGVKKLNIPAVQAEMLPNSLDLAAFPLQPRSAVQNGRIRIGILANLIPVKNQLAAIACLKPLLRENRASLLLGGDAHDKIYAHNLNQAALDLPVCFMGYVNDVAGFMARLDVLLLTSLQEGWPVVLMEAMACGVPVIAPALGDIPELLTHGQAGLLYPAGHYDEIPRLLDLLQKPVIYSRFSAKGIERVREFDVHRIVAPLMRTVQELTLQAGGTSA